MPMMIEDYDDLFTDPLSLTPSPPPKGLHERLDELRSNGATQYVHLHTSLSELEPDPPIGRSSGPNWAVSPTSLPTARKYVWLIYRTTEAMALGA